MNDKIIVFARIGMREEAARLVERCAGKQPCDCASKDDSGFWRDECQCRNFDDKGRIASWCSDMNTATAIRSIPEHVVHDSDCSLHNMPAYPNGPCDCSVAETRSSPLSRQGR